MSKEFAFDIAPYMDYARLQVSQTQVDVNDYLKLTRLEFETAQPHIGNPKRVLDLGCGLGRSSVYMNYRLGDPSIHYVLADSTQVPASMTAVRTGWNPGAVFYNDMCRTAAFARAHGLTNFSTIDIRESPVSELAPVDLVMSFLSVGFHYPIEDALPDLIRILNPGGVMIFGVRHGIYSNASFRGAFKYVTLIQDTIAEGMGGRSREDLLILRGPL